MDEILTELGRAVREGRKQLGVTQVELAELAGTSYRPVYLIEKGQSVHLETFVKLCDALGFSIAIGPRSSINDA